MTFIEAVHALEHGTAAPPLPDRMLARSPIRRDFDLAQISKRGQLVDTFTDRLILPVRGPGARIQGSSVATCPATPARPPLG